MSKPRFVVAIAAVGAAAVLAGCAGAGHAAGPTTVATTAVPTATTQQLNLPVVKAAGDMACVTDFETLRTAENLYKTVNGAYATLQQLLIEQFIAAPLTYFTDVKIGTPVGGYTLIAAKNGPCASLPVRD